MEKIVNKILQDLKVCEDNHTSLNLDSYGDNFDVDKLESLLNEHGEVYETSYDDYSNILDVFKGFIEEEIQRFKKAWGQTDEEAIEAFSLDDDEDTTEIMQDDYFYDDNDCKWYNKASSLFTDREQEIANYLRENL